MNLTDLEAFVSVLDQGSIVAASAALHLTQSAVPRRVQNLEDVLGVPLLDRQTRPLQPTRAGAETYEFAKPVLSSVRDLKAAVMLNGEPAGDLRFGLSRGLGDLTLLAPVRSLRSRFPKVHMHLYVQWSANLLEQLTGRVLDAAVIVLPEGSTPPSSFIAECIGTEPISILAGKSSRLTQHCTLEELSAHPWVVNPHGCSTRLILENELRQHGLPFNCAVESEGYDLQFMLVAEGVGLGIAMPQIYYHSHLRTKLKLLKLTDFSPRMNIWLVQSKHIGRLAPAIQCLRDAVQESLKKKPIRRDQSLQRSRPD